MSVFIKIIFLIFIFLSCSKKEKNALELKKIDSKELLGTWKIVPSGGEKILFEPQSKAKILTQSGEQVQVYLRADSEGMRILESEQSTVPLGYFLFMEKKETIWSGVYKKQLVRLEKEVILKKSVLE
ncbi:MAG: hypothetical protein N3A69_16665 [Leptospiraceae bacterium]|nr:hypothetical protein [Leptospiraceae bacterium]